MGQKLIFPSSIIGRPRNNIQQRKQDAMVYVSKNGRLDIFFTMTCNPNLLELNPVYLKFLNLKIDMTLLHVFFT